MNRGCTCGSMGCGSGWEARFPFPVLGRDVVAVCWDRSRWCFDTYACGLMFPGASFWETEGSRWQFANVGLGADLQSSHAGAEYAGRTVCFDVSAHGWPSPVGIAIWGEKRARKMAVPVKMRITAIRTSNEQKRQMRTLAADERGFKGSSSRGQIEQREN